ncbi:Uncharacterised protein [uncultured archaeon]|nr:Uncharacterised protein [uncultured archaeon]
MKKILMAGLLAVGSALAQTGDYGRAIGTEMMQKAPMYGGFSKILMCVLLVGVTIAVWLYAYKLFKEIRKMK